MKKFWIIIRVNAGEGSTKKYDTEKEAIEEAFLLASKENCSFYILEAIGIVAPVNRPVEYKKFKDD